MPPGPPPGPPPRKGGAGLVIALLAAGLAVAVVAVVGAVLLTRDGEAEGGDDPPRQRLLVGQIAGGAEARPGEDGSLTMVRPGVTSPVVEIYADFACPHCGTFDRMVDPMLKRLAVDGKAKVIYRPMVIFSKGMEPMHGNSLRAASAMRCLGDGARWLAYQDALYAHQPGSQYTRGYELADLVSYAAPLGVGDAAFRECVNEQRYASSVLATSGRYTSEGVGGTPTVRVDGRALPTSALGSAEEIRRAIENGG
ncbi:DsbA family protein [Actinomadura rugatobispora]|uniref:DsbA family protein n=1 Tax=Actinomadura rugatobispora TaxID=1994 RepID=A0ABW1AHD3_9ACTN